MIIGGASRGYYYIPTYLGGFILLFSDTFTCTENRSIHRRRLNTPYNIIGIAAIYYII